MKYPLIAFFLAAAAVGCSGGGSSTPVESPTVQPRVTVKVEVAVPSALVTSGVQSVVVAFIPVGEIVPPAIAPLTINVASGSSDCVTTAGKTECSGTISVPLGQQNFTISLESGANGTGAQLGVKAFTASINGAGQIIDISSANGSIQIIATVQVVINPSSITAGTAATVNVSVDAFDSSGRLITSPYNVPVSLIPPPTASPGQPPTLTDPSPGPGVALLPTGVLAITATGPNQLFPFSYSGTSIGLPAAFVFSASAQGVTTVSSTLNVALPPPPPTPTPTATPTPAPTVGPFSTPSPGPIAVAPNVLLFEAPNAPAQSFVASEAGSAAFTAVSSNVAVATVSGTGSTLRVTPVGVGLAVITVSDGAGHTGTVNAYVNSSTIIISGRRRHQ